MKQKTVNTFFLTMGIILAACMNVGCTETLADLSGENGEPTPEKSPISFLVYDNSFNEDKPTTRGSVVSSAADITNFGVSAAVYSSSGGSYTTTSCGSYFYKENATAGVPLKYFWPNADNRMAFYAYYPYGNSNLTLPESPATGIPTYSYTVPEAIGSQIDVMTAQVTDVNPAAQTVLPLSFRHRCSDIRFFLSNPNDEDIQINSISLAGMKYSGTYQSGWSLSNTTKTFTLNVNTTLAAEAEDVDITGTTNHFIMLPQTVAVGTNMIVINLTVEDEVVEEAYTLPTAVTFEEGKRYSFFITIEEFSKTPIDVLASVSNWTLETNTDGIPEDRYTIESIFSAVNWEYTSGEEDPDIPEPQYPVDPGTNTVNDWQSEE